MNRMNTGRIPHPPKQLSAKRTKINQMSNEEMGGNYQTVTGNLNLYLTGRGRKNFDTLLGSV
jgi:hypothetical protein